MVNVTVEDEGRVVHVRFERQAVDPERVAAMAAPPAEPKPTGVGKLLKSIMDATARGREIRFSSHGDELRVEATYRYWNGASGFVATATRSKLAEMDDPDHHVADMVRDVVLGAYLSGGGD